MSELTSFVSFRAGPADKEALRLLKQALGVSGGGVLRLLVRDAAARIASGGRAPVLERLATPGRNEDGGMHYGSTNLGDQ